MTERRPWAQEQDKILKHLREEQKVKKWSQIAKIMESNYGIQGRNQKQCRQRYQNHLDSLIVTQKLSEQEQRLLFQLHDDLGNKWSVIANNFPGRTDNTLKNHFHSKLRGAVRKINRYLGCKKKRGTKSYPLSIVYKIVKYFGQNGKDVFDLVEHTTIKALKNGLLRFSGANIASQQQDLNQKNEKKMAQKLVVLLERFEKMTKSTSKKKISQAFEEQFSNCGQNKIQKTQQSLPQSHQKSECQLFRTFSKNSFIDKKSSLKQNQQRIQTPIPIIYVPLYKQMSKAGYNDVPELQFQKIQLKKKESSQISQTDSDIRRLVQQNNISSMSKNPGMHKLSSFGSYSMEMVDESQFRRNDSLVNKSSNIWTKQLNYQSKLDSCIFQ